MMKQKKANADEDEVDSPTSIMKKHLIVGKVVADDIMRKIADANRQFVVRKFDYAFTLPIDDLDSLRFHLRYKKIED